MNNKGGFVAKHPEYSLQSPNQTKNYVVFNDKLIDIVKKYGLAGLVAGGASHFQASPVDYNPFPGDQQAGMAGGGAVDPYADFRRSTNVEVVPPESEAVLLYDNFVRNVTGQNDNWISDLSNAVTGRTPLAPAKMPDTSSDPLAVSLGYNEIGNHAKGGAVKATKKTVHYTTGRAQRRCGLCTMFRKPDKCTAVAGIVSAGGVCDLFERKKELGHSGKARAATPRGHSGAEVRK